MNLQELYELKHTRTGLLAEGRELLEEKDFAGHKSKLAEVDRLNEEIDAGERQLAEEGRFEAGNQDMKNLHKSIMQQNEDDKKQRSLNELRGENEYAQAFAKAMKNQASVKKSVGVEDYKPLYKALSESGGTPVGADGGFLVPIDFDNRILQLEKEYLDLANFFHVESVSTLSGWRAVADGVPKALPSVSELGTIGKEDQPKFRRIDYTVRKYADRLPISSELLDDNAANLLAYVADWFAPKYILTKNTLLLAFLQALTSTVALTTGNEDKQLRQALIRQLNTAHSRKAVLLTNQDGYAEMDGWEDANGRSLLVPNPADPQVMRYRGRTVDYGDNDLIPSSATTAPIYVGNFKSLGTLFVRKGIELATTSVGGDAWATDSSEVRAICRLDAKAVDKNAAFVANAPISVG